MKLKDIKDNIYKFNSDKAINLFEKNNNMQYYYSKEYAKNFKI